MAIMQPCLGCGTLTPNTRCDVCQKPLNNAHDRRRRQKKRETRQYAGNYRERARIVRANATHCHLCGKAFTPTDRINADHLEPGNPNSPLAAAHALCNQRRGNKPITE